MKLFLDTSSLVKLYHKENDSDIIRQIYTDQKVITFLSEISKIEFYSTFWKKVRVNEISLSEAKIITALFEADVIRYKFIPVNDIIIEPAKIFIEKYGIQGLRALDSIQFATALSLRDQCELFITTDKLLHSFFQQESLPVL